MADDWFGHFFAPHLDQLGGVEIRGDEEEEPQSDNEEDEDDEDDVIPGNYLQAEDPTLQRRVRAEAVAALPIPVREYGDGIALREHVYFISRPFNVRGVQYNFVPLNNANESEDVFQNFVNFLDSIYSLIHGEFSPNDYVQVNINSSDLSDRQIGAPLVRVRDASAESLLAQLENIVQSNHDLALDSGNLYVEVQHVVVPEARGYGHQRNKLFVQMKNKLEEILKQTRSLMKVDLRMDPFCAAVAMLAGVHHHKLTTLGRPVVNFRRLFSYKRKLYRECQVLFRQAGLTVSRGVRIDKFVKLGNLPRFSDYEFHIFMARPCLQCVKVVNPDACLGPISVYVDGGDHCYLMTSVNAIFGKTGRLCPHCNKFFVGHPKAHKCDNFCCKQCKCRCDSFRLPNALATLQCDSCLRYFLSRDCFDLHLKVGASRLCKAGVSVCESVMACLTCARDLKAVGGIRTDRNAYETTSKKNALHVCFKSRCRLCGALTNMSAHTCFVRPIDPWTEGYQKKLLRKRGVLYFFDVECCNVKRHCDDGIERNFFVSDLVVLQREDGAEWMWEDESSMDGFCEFVFLSEISLANTEGKKTILGHNTSGFDSILLLKNLLTYLTEDPKLVFKNNSIYSLVLGNVTIRCSFLYFQCALAKLPKTFGIDCEKGYFPHLFNKFENRDYVGLLPGEEFFSPDFMSAEGYEKFHRWHSETDALVRSGELPAWNFRQELIKYC